MGRGGTRPCLALRSWFEDPFGAPLAGQLQARLEKVSGEDVYAAQLEQAGEDEADRPLARDEHDIAPQQGEVFDGLEDGVDRFLHGAFDEGVSAGDFNDTGKNEGHDANILGVAAAGGLEAGGDAGAFVLGTLGEGAMAAGVAAEAGNMMMQGDAFTDAESPDARADADDGAGGFVAEDARWRHGAVVDFLDVGGANTAGGDFDQQVISGNARDGKCFEAEVVHAAINDGLHGFGNGKHG